MSKTLQVVSVLAAICVVILVALPVIFGSGIDEQTQKLLDSPGVVAVFRASAGSAVSSEQDSPLVRQAQAFALYLNPPAPPKPRVREPRRTTSPTPRPMAPVTTKFNLIGTSYYPLRPEMSLALIDEPGKGLRWVRQSSEVGHLIIEQVKDGVVVVKDGERTFELTAERPDKVSLLKSDGPRVTSRPAGIETPRPPAPTAGRARPQTRIASRRPTDRTSRPTPVSAVVPEPSPEEIALLERFMKETEGIMDEDEWMKKAEELLGAASQAERVSEDEAQQLEQLGEELSDSNEAEE